MPAVYRKNMPVLFLGQTSYKMTKPRFIFKILFYVVVAFCLVVHVWFRCFYLDLVSSV